VTFYVLAVMHLKTRRVHIAGITPSPNAVWMRQVCRNLTDCEDGFLKDASHLIVDRDTGFLALRDYLSQNTDTEVVLLPPKSPNLNAFMERWSRSLKSESLNRMIFFGKRSLERAVAEYVAHYHAERNHQGLSNKLIEPGGEVGSVAGKIDCRERLGGMLKYYQRRAARTTKGPVAVASSAMKIHTSVTKTPSPQPEAVRETSKSTENATGFAG
jgi:putative transposase